MSKFLTAVAIFFLLKILSDNLCILIFLDFQMNMDAIENTTDDDLKALGLNTMGDLLALRHFCQSRSNTASTEERKNNTSSHGSKCQRITDKRKEKKNSASRMA